MNFIRSHQWSYSVDGFFVYDTDMENETSAFLGRDYQWAEAQVRLEDVQPLFGGVRLWIPNWGKPFVWRVVSGGRETRYKIPFDRDEKVELLQLFVAQDFLTMAPWERAGIPDEARPFITLTNHKREIHTVTKWAGVQDERFDTLYDALLAIAGRSRDVKPELERLRPLQKILFIVGLIFLICAPFVLGNLLARVVVNASWPGAIGWLITWIPVLSLGVILLLFILYWRERDKPNREQHFTSPILGVICGLLLVFVFMSWMGLVQKKVLLRWSETAVGTVQSLDHQIVYNGEYGWDDFYKVGYVFQTESGDGIGKVSFVGRRYFDELEVDTAVTVYYSPFFPRYAALEQSVQSPTSAIIAIMFLSATILIIIVWGLFAKRLRIIFDQRF